MIGGKPDRTYVKGETFLATSSAFGLAMLPNQRIAAGCWLEPSITSGTSVIPNQLITAATLGIGGNDGGFAAAAAAAPAGAPPRAPAGAGGAAAPAHSWPSPALAGMMPMDNARCPPADSPVTTILFLSML